MAPLQGFWIRNRSDMQPSAVIELAVAAEEGGWDGVFVSDAVQEDHTDPLTLLSAVAAVTSDVRLGTWVIPLPARDVVAVARAAAVVDALSGGRLLVGVGLGNETEHAGLGTDRGAGSLGARYDAAVEVLAELLTGAAVTRHDAFHDLEGVALNQTCVQQPRPPILCAVQSDSEAPLRRAARMDGLMPFWPGVAEGQDPDVEAGAAERGLRDIVAAYERHAGEPGTVVAPRTAHLGASYDAACDELGVAWQLTCDDLDADALRAGPPRRPR